MFAQPQMNPMMMPPMGPQTGMDPICLIALQAGMSGRSASSQPLSLDDQIADIENSLKELKKRVDKLKGELLGKGRNTSDIFKTLVCKEGNDNTGNVCTDSNGSQKRVKKSSIVGNTIEHIYKEKDAPSACAEVPGGGVVFYFEKFLPHLQYAGLPLKLITPSIAVADSGHGGVLGHVHDINLSTGDEQPSGVTAPPLQPSVQEEPDREPAAADETCECPGNSSAGPDDDGKCVVPAQRGLCPIGWGSAQVTIQSAGVSSNCSVACTDGLEIKWLSPIETPEKEEPAPPEGSCSNRSDCATGKKCESNRCVDLCPPETPAWVISGQKCMCVEDSSCGSEKVCQNGECKKEAPAPAPAPGTRGSFDWCKDENCECRYKQYFGDDGDVDIDGLCEDPLLLQTDTDGNVDRRTKSRCKSRWEWLMEDLQEIVRLEEELVELREKREEEEVDAEYLRRRCERNPNLQVCQQRGPGATEAGAPCVNCGFNTEAFQEVIDAAYPKKSGWDKLLEAVVPLAGTGLAYHGVKETNKLRARQGFPVDNSAMYGLAYPFIAQMLYGGALNGRGRNALACSPSAHMNPYSGIFSANFHGAGHLGMIPGMIPGINGGFFGQGGISVPGYAGGMFNVGGGFSGGGIPGYGGFGGGGIPGYGGFGGGGIPGYGGLGGGSIPGYGGLGGAGGFNYQSQLQMQQRMQSYYMQLQQFQMEQQRIRQSVMMRYQQEAQSLAFKYQSYISDISHPSYPGGGGQPPYTPYSPGGIPPGGVPPGGVPGGAQYGP